MPANRERQDTARLAARLPCKSAAGSLIALLSWSRQRVRGNRISRRRPPHVASSPACARRQSVRLPAAKAQRPRQATEQRQAFKKALRRLQRSQSLLAAPPRWSLVCQTNRIVEITSGVALWYRGGVPPVPIRWLLVAIPLASSSLRPFWQPILTPSERHPCWFVSRWQVEVTFEKPALISASKPSANGPIRQSCAHAGPARHVLHRHTLAHDLSKSRKLNRKPLHVPKAVSHSAMHSRGTPRNMDHQISFMSRPHRDTIEIPRHIWTHDECARHAV